MSKIGLKNLGSRVAPLVPCFLLFGFNKETLKQTGKRVLLRDLKQMGVGE